ncbi:MAG: cytochrome b/b6 domain-containing protein, partial [Spongiibacteraceae bacterium]|nr:cytochrome b/b6 domain-containing protein [Spongiibacteraceae bacterium]
LIFTIILIRVIWRIRAGWPQAVSQYTRIEQLLSKTVHWVLMIATVLMPIFGLIGSGLDGHGFGFFGLEIVAENPDPTKPFASIPYNETVAEASKEMHELVGTLLMAAIALHVVGALKHHLIDKDGTMRRIFGAKV